MKHPTEIIGYTSSMQDLAKEVAMLRYDKLHEFLTSLSMQLTEDGSADCGRGRLKLGSALYNAANHVSRAANHINEASFICRPYNEYNENVPLP